MRRFRSAPVLTSTARRTALRTVAFAAVATTCSLTASAAFAESPVVPGADESPAVAATTAAELTATPPVNLALVKAKGAVAVAQRLARIVVLNSRVAQVKGDCGDNATLTGQLAANTSGLTALGATLAAETDLAKAKAEYQQIFGGYRIYILQNPKTRIVLNCGNNVPRITSIQQDAAEIQAKIDAATAAGKNAAVSQAAVTDALAKASTASSTGTAASHAVIALTPDGGDKTKLAALRSALSSAEAQMKSADQSIAVARADLAAARKALPKLDKVKPAKPAKPAGGAAPAPSSTVAA